MDMNLTEDKETKCDTGIATTKLISLAGMVTGLVLMASGLDNQNLEFATKGTMLFGMSLFLLLSS